MPSASDINNNVNALLNADTQEAKPNANMVNEGGDLLSSFSSSFTQAIEYGDFTAETELMKNFEKNLETFEDAMNHNESYQKLFRVLHQSLNTATPSLRVTYVLVMTYLSTHYFNLKRIDGGQITITADFNEVQTKYSDCGVPKTSSFTPTTHVREFILQETPAEDLSTARVKFYHMLALLLNHQIQQNYLQMYQDAVLRIQYVLGSFYTLHQVVQQQNTSIELLTQLSEYVNEQVTEYSTVYEQLSTLIATQERKITFQTDDIQTLELWQFWCKVGFWVLVVFFVLMFIVDHMMDISQFTSDMDDRLKRAASAAGQATQALVGSR